MTLVSEQAQHAKMFKHFVAKTRARCHPGLKTLLVVSFRWKDYRHGSQMRTLTLDVDEFLRRFLRHVLPKRFVRIRYFGFFASRTRTRGLARCRQVLAVSSPPPDTLRVTPPRRASWPCPRCGAPMRLIERLTARQLFLDALLAEIVHDTS